MKKLYSVVRKNPDLSTTIEWTGNDIVKANLLLEDLCESCYHIVEREMTE